MFRNQRSPQEVADGIFASMNACRAIVAAFADGRLKPEYVNGTRPQDFRYAPSFRLGMPRDSAGVPYSICHVTATLYASGKNTLIRNGAGHYSANRYIVLAMQLLAGIEESYIDEKFMLENLRTGKVPISRLRLELRARRQAHEIFPPWNAKLGRYAYA